MVAALFGAQSRTTRCGPGHLPGQFLPRDEGGLGAGIPTTSATSTRPAASAATTASTRRGQQPPVAFHRLQQLPHDPCAGRRGRPGEGRPLRASRSGTRRARSGARDCCAVTATTGRTRTTKHDVFGFERRIKPSPERARLISCSRIRGVVHTRLRRARRHAQRSCGRSALFTGSTKLGMPPRPFEAAHMGAQYLQRLGQKKVSGGRSHVRESGDLLKP